MMNQNMNAQTQNTPAMLSRDSITALFPNVSANAIVRAQQAKNPLSTKLGQAILGNSFALLQMFAADNEQALDPLCACVNMIHILCGHDILPNNYIAFYTWKYCVNSHIGKGDYATISLGAWKKVLKEGMPSLTYNAPKKQYTVVGLESIVFDAPALRQGDVLSVKYRSMTPAEKVEQAKRLREKLEKDLKRIEALEAAALAEQGEKGD